MSNLTKATLIAANYLGISQAELAKALDLNPATVERMYQGNHPLEANTDAWDLASLLVRLFCNLDALMGGDDAAVRSWMRTRNTEIDAVPAELICSKQGLVRVVGYLDAYRAKV